MKRILITCVWNFIYRWLTTHKFVKVIFNSPLDRNGEEYYICNTEILYCLQIIKGKGFHTTHHINHRRDMYAGSNLLHSTEQEGKKPQKRNACGLKERYAENAWF
jgi:hypothetical protein